MLSLFLTSDRDVDLSWLVNPQATFGRAGDIAYVCTYNFLAKFDGGKTDPFFTPS
jgi:hypothetical protein